MDVEESILGNSYNAYGKRDIVVDKIGLGNEYYFMGKRYDRRITGKAVFECVCEE